MAFTVPLVGYFQKLQLLVVKKFELIFAALYFMSSKSTSQIFRALFQTGDINIFVLLGLFFSRYVQLKNSFSDEENINGEIETHFSRKAIEN